MRTQVRTMDQTLLKELVYRSRLLAYLAQWKIVLLQFVIQLYIKGL
jgi:hypothetical protein